MALLAVAIMLTAGLQVDFRRRRILGQGSRAAARGPVYGDRLHRGSGAAFCSPDAGLLIRRQE